MKENNERRIQIPPLPRTAAEYLAKRKIKAKWTLNDAVESIHLDLASDETYQSYLEAVYDEQAIEGSQKIDDVKAAEMIRQRAGELDNALVKKQKLASLVKALKVVLRRSGDSREERRNMLHGETTIHGEVVPPSE